MLYNKINLEVSRFASTNESRPELTGVFFTKDKVVATDSFKLVEITTPRGLKVEDYPKVNGKAAMRGFKPFIVPAKELSKIKISSNKDLPMLNNMAVSYVDDKRVDFITTDLESVQVKSLRRIDGQYPDYERVFPKSKPKAEVLINGDFLAEVAELLAKTNKLRSIRVKFYGENMPLVIESSGEEQTARAMVMPMRK